MHLKDGHFNCISVTDKDHFFIELELLSKHPVTGEDVPFQLSIPRHYVLYTLRAGTETRKEMGFKDED